MGLEIREDFESQRGVEIEVNFKKFMRANAQGSPIFGELGLKRARRSKLEFVDRLIMGR